MECIVDVKKWMTCNLLLNFEKKTEVLIIGPKTPKINNLEHCLTLDVDFCQFFCHQSGN